MTLDQILARVDPKPLSPAETLKRYRIQRAALIQKIISAAEERYPGIGQTLASIDAKIEYLEDD